MSRGEAIALSFAGMLAMAAGVGIGRFVYTPILPEMQQALGWTAATAGFIASANSLGYLVGALATALLGLRGDLRLVLLVALAASALTTMAMALGDNVLVGIIVRFLGGVASAVVIVCASTVVLKRLQASGQDSVASFHFAGIGLGMAISALAVALAFGAGADWALLWVVTGLISFAVLPFVMWWIKPASGAASQPEVSAADGGARVALVLFILAYGLFAYGYMVTATFIVTMVRQDPALAQMEAYVWLMVGVSAMPSVALWTWVGRLLGIAQAFALACVVLSAGIAASVLWHTEGGILLAAAILGSCYMGLTALGLSAAQNLSGARDGKAIGWMTTSSGLGQTLGPAAAGIMIDHFDGFRAPILLAAALCLVAAVLAVFAAKARAGAGT